MFFPCLTVLDFIYKSNGNQTVRDKVSFHFMCRANEWINKEIKISLMEKHPNLANFIWKRKTLNCQIKTQTTFCTLPSLLTSSLCLCTQSFLEFFSEQGGVISKNLTFNLIIGPRFPACFQLVRSSHSLCFLAPVRPLFSDAAALCDLSLVSTVSQRSCERKKKIPSC